MNYKVLDTYEIDVETVNNPYSFDQHELFEMALRINKKRSFLFVSKVLGKHLAVHPSIPLLTGHLLAERFKGNIDTNDRQIQKMIQALKTDEEAHETLKKSRTQKLVHENPLLVIGFAETATALGHGFFEKLTGNVHYIHTTREHLVDQAPVICFEEEHSHATSHRLYANESLFLDVDEIVLVDDEMTTGKTNCNIIRQLKETYKQIEKITIATILDFRTQAFRDDLNALAQELDISITCISLFSGEFTLKEQVPSLQERVEPIPQSLDAIPIYDTSAMLQNNLMMQQSYSDVGVIEQANYYQLSGRFQLSTSAQLQIEKDVKGVAERLKKTRASGKCLVLGTGEFMYVPMAIANEMGEEVYYHATTRSPIYADPSYLIYNKQSFKSAELPGVANYLYNIPLNTYTDIFLIYERIIDMDAAKTLYVQLKRYAKHVHVVTLGGVKVEL